MQLDLRLPLPLLRQQLETVLASVAEEVRAGIQVKPKGEIKLSGQGPYLQSVIPVRITATADWLNLGARVLGGIALPGLLTFELAVSLRTRLSLAEDWRLLANSEVAYQWTRDPATGLGLIQLPLKELVEPLLERELRKIGQQVDTWVPALTEVPQRMAEAWRELQRPMPLDEPLQLRLRPRKEPIPVGQIQVDGQALRVAVQLPIRAMVNLPAALEGIPVLPLPDPIALTDQGESRLKIQVGLPWSYLVTEWGSQSIEDHSLRRPLRISWGEVSLAGEGDLFSVETSIRIKGLPGFPRRTLRGTLRLDWRWRPRNGALAVELVQARLHDLPRWVQAIWSLIGPYFYPLMARALSQVVDQQVEQAKADLVNLVQDFPLTGGGRLFGQIQRVEILDVLSDDQGLQAKIRLSGVAKVILTEV